VIKSFLTNSFGILLSRVFGFIRDLLMASALGASIYTDFFVIAFKVPNLLRRIFAEGAFSQVFIPAFIGSSHKLTFASYIFIFFLSIISILSLLVYFFSFEFTSVIALGLESKYISELHKIVAINFFYIILVFIFTFISAILHYKKHFFTTSISTSFLNISIIIAILLPSSSKLDLVYNISYGVIVGGILQVIAHILAIYFLKLATPFYYAFISLKKKYKTIKQNIKIFNEKLLPAIIGASSYQLASFLDIFLASFLASSSISYLYFANRVFQFPFALFTIALSISIFPVIAKLIKSDNQEKALLLMKKSFYFIITLLSSATIIGIIFSEFIISLLFQRGEFNAQDSLNSSYVLVAYLVGLIPFGLSKIFSLWLFSKQEQKKAAFISVISIIANIIFSLLLIYKYKVVGLALASSISGVVQLGLSIYYFGLKNFLDNILDFKYSMVFVFITVMITILSLNIVSFI
jgi:putative peptidoglycan lipid II flippase